MNYLDRLTSGRTPLLLSIAALFLLFLPHPATAQSETEEIQARVHAGERLRVTSTDGKRITGRFEGIFGASIRLVREFQAMNTPVSSIQLIEKRHPERWWKGALVGAAPGITYMSLFAMQSSCDKDYCAVPGVTFSLLGAGIGVIIDRAIPRYDAVYLRPTRIVRINALPLLSGDRKGIAFAFTP